MGTPIEFLALTTEDVNIRVRLFGKGRQWHTARSWRKADQRDAKIMAERTKYQAGVRAVMRLREACACPRRASGAINCAQRFGHSLRAGLFCCRDAS